MIHGSKKQLETISPQEEAALRETDFYVFTMGPRSPIRWSSISKEKRQEVSVWLDTRYDRSAYARKWARAAKARRVKMLAIEATLATPERAKGLGLNYEMYRRVVFRGCRTDHNKLARRAKKLTKIMSRTGRVRVTSAAGTQLSFDLDRRPVGVSDGISTDEMAESGRIVFLPAGAIEVSIDEKSSQGRIVYDRPVKLSDTIINNLAVDLQNGRIIRHTAAKGSHVVEQYLKKGGTDAGRLAFFGFGLNPDLKLGFTQDDKVLGGLTLGFGSNKSMGGQNVANDQWWASISRATLEIDDHLLLERGRLLI